jgi:DUF4097 and DUF4098 domain-containing protein YvlB
VLQGAAQESELVIEKKFNGVKRVLVGTSGGNISVTGGSTSGAVVKVQVRPSNYNEKVPEQELRARLERDYELKVEMVGDQLQCSAKPKRKVDWKQGLSVSFDLVVPNKTTNDLATSGGNIVLRDLEGTQKLATSGGNLVLEGCKGQLRGTTSGGNIIAERLTEDVELSTSGGNVSVEECRGKLRFTTSGGNITLEDLDGNITAKTSGGNINGDELKGEIETQTSGGNVEVDNVSGSLKASTSGGSMNVSIIQTGSYVELSNSGGNIRVELPAGKGYNLNVRGDDLNTTSLSNFSGTISDNRIEGKLNGGGIPVNISRAGKVNLIFKN